MPLYQAAELAVFDDDESLGHELVFFEKEVVARRMLQRIVLLTQ
jgi:hypothetical protein